MARVARWKTPSASGGSAAGTTVAERPLATIPTPHGPGWEFCLALDFILGIFLLIFSHVNVVTSYRVTHLLANLGWVDFDL